MPFLKYLVFNKGDQIIFAIQVIAFYKQIRLLFQKGFQPIVSQGLNLALPGSRVGGICCNPVEAGVVSTAVVASVETLSDESIIGIYSEGTTILMHLS